MANQTKPRPNMNQHAKKGTTPPASAPQGKIKDAEERLPTSHADPAAVPLGTDAEAGTGEPVKPRAEPADTYIVNTDGEVSAGPGDAGKQREAELLDDVPRTTGSSYGAIMGIVIGILFILLIAFLFFA